MVEYSTSTGQVLVAFHATFKALIPKTRNPISFDHFRSISLYNSIYKIISKLISSRLKDILSDNISFEQFGFLKGRKNHESIGLDQEGLTLHPYK
jgi:hypothetical protein